MTISWRRLAVALAGLGLVGVSSLALLPIEQLAPGPLPAPAGALRLLSLINPALLVLLAAWVGTLLASRMGLDAPALRLALAGVSPVPVLRRQAPLALSAGFGTGLLLAGYAALTGPLLQSLGTADAIRLQALTPPLLTRLLYGGITEELLARWLVMTLACWLAWRVVGGSARVPTGIYWIGMVAAALVFAMAHLPFLYAVVGSAPVWTAAAATAVNGIAGMVYGWFFWRRGLEAAMMAHVLTHATAAIAGVAAA